MAPSYPSIPNTDLEAGDRASQQFWQSARLRDVGNSEKLIDLEFAEKSTTSGTPVTAPLDHHDGDPRVFPVDGNRLTFACDVRNSNGATTGTVTITVGGVDSNTIPINAGDTSDTPKTVDVTLTATGSRSVLVQIQRDSGAGTVYCKAPGLISRTWNSET